ncbi:hypothetical protein D5S17_33135 [Pseudonocardiaceae bacterium YIM PH 21723]|nr:hypothetical protein D5S17_33135 [Pseudonocardiaceae bacterium YIM PH 21723]
MRFRFLVVAAATALAMGAIPPTANAAAAGPAASNTVSAVDCTYAAEWNSTTNYSAGNQVRWSNHLYQARSANRNIPPTNTTYWTDFGTCDGGGNPGNCTYLPYWVANTTYTTGSQVQWNNRRYEARATNTNVQPGNTAYWTDLGTCTDPAPPNPCLNIPIWANLVSYRIGDEVKWHERRYRSIKNSIAIQPNMPWGPLYWADYGSCQ